MTDDRRAGEQPPEIVRSADADRLPEIVRSPEVGPPPQVVRGSEHDRSEVSDAPRRRVLRLTQALVGAIAESPAFRQADVRQSLREEVEDRLGPLNLRDSLPVRPAVAEIVRHCGRRPGGLADLAESVETLVMGEPVCSQVRRIVEEIEALQLEPSLEPVWDDLRAALSSVSLEHARERLQHATDGRVGPLPSHVDGTWAAFIHLVGWTTQPHQPALRPWAVFLELLRRDFDSRTNATAGALLNGLAVEWRAVEDLSTVESRFDASTPRPARAGIVTVVVSPDPSAPESFTVYSVQRWDDDYSAARRDGDDVTVDRAELEATVEAVVARAEEAWAARPVEIMLEFVLPLTLLNAPVEWWPKDSRNPPPSPLALYHTVVLRSFERLRNPAWHRVWMRRWERLVDDPRGARILRCEDPGRLDHAGRLEAELASDDSYVGVVLSAPPGPDLGQSQEITVALRAGIPLVLWHRAGPPGTELLEHVTELEDGLGEVPARVAALRRQVRGLQPDERESHAVQELSVLWDDASRRPDMTKVRSS